MKQYFVYVVSHCRKMKQANVAADRTQSVNSRSHGSREVLCNIKTTKFPSRGGNEEFSPGGGEKKIIWGMFLFANFGQSRCRLRTYRIGNGENSLSGVFIVAGGQWKKEILLLFKKKRNSAWILNPLKKSAAGPLWSTD
jgi:hypothetical protein